MRVSRQTWWQLGKVLLTLAILVSVGWQFTRVLSASELWRTGMQVRPGWSVLCGCLYLLGLGCSALFWYLLLEALGQQPTGLGTLRAYYVGQLGRYVPGKIVAVVLRAQLLSGPGVNTRVAVLTVLYESFTTLTAGVILAVIFLPWGAANPGDRRWHALGLLVLIGVPLLPAVFNRLVRKFMAPLCDKEAVPPPGLRAATLVEGLAITGCGWALQGASLWALLQALLPETQSWSWETWASFTAFIAVATALGFLVVVVPGGLGVRELILQQSLAVYLTPQWGAEEALTTSVVAVLLLRLVWTVAEVATAGIVYWLPAQSHGEPLPRRSVAS